MSITQKLEQPFGVAERANNRKKQQKSVESHTHSLIFTYLPELTKAEINLSSKIYKTKLSQLFERIRTDYPSIKEFRISRNYLSRFINEGNNSGKWQLDIPPYIQRVQREAPLRNAKWFKTSRILNLWQKNWLEHLEQTSAVKLDTSAEEVLACTLISSAIFGGLCLPEALEALKQKLLNERKPLRQSNDKIWIDLTFDSKTQAHNEYIDDIQLTMRRWYPDNFTLAWINHFIGEKSTTIKKVPTAWVIIKKYLDKISKGTSKSIGSINRFCVGAVGVTENLDGVRLNQAMVEYLVGRIPSASLTMLCQNAVMLQHDYLPILNINDRNSFQLPETRVTGVRNNLKLTTNYEAVITQIRACLSKIKIGGHKNTPEAARKELEKINHSLLPESFSTLIEWLITLLSENKKVTTVSRYFSAIGKPWLSWTAGLDIDELDGEDFESLYRDILDTQISEDNRRYMAGRFNQFHLFLSRYHDLPVLLNTLDDMQSTSRPFIRAAFITERAFTAFIESLNAMPLPQREIQKLKCLFILAYRTGLRRGELLKLRLQDIEPSLERWLFIVNNKYGDNKSSSGFRKVPLTVLLIDEEVKLFEDYLAHKRLHDDSAQALLFSQEHAPHIPLDGNFVSTLAKNLLTEITGFPVIFHHFRHTALSRLHVILEDDQELLYKIARYSDNHTQQIKKAVGGFDNPEVKRDIYWALAGFAGHLTPETTFSNYLHFTDQIVANKLKKAKLKFSANVIRQVTGLSRNLITRHTIKHAKAVDQIDLALFADELRHRLKKYSEILKSPATLNNTINNPIYLHKQNNATAETCLAVLEAAEQKASMRELVLKFNLEETVISRWLEKAREIAQLTTSKNKSRVFSRYKSSTALGEPLSPPKPQSNAELQDVVRAINTLRKLYPENKEAINWCIEHFINNTNTSNSGIIFSTPTELQKYLKIMVQVFPRTRWHLRFTPLSDLSVEDQVIIWQQHSENLSITQNADRVRRKSKYPQGKLTLLLAHPDETNIIKDNAKSQYSTNVITYIFHILAIMI